MIVQAPAIFLIAQPAIQCCIFNMIQLMRLSLAAVPVDRLCLE